jgi:hypothetical protein
MIYFRKYRSIRPYTQALQLSSLFRLTAGGGESACNKKPVAEPTSTQSNKSGMHSAGELWLTPEQERLAEPEVDTAVMRMVGDELKLIGILEVPPQHYARLHAPIPAYVKGVRVK